MDIKAKRKEFINTKCFYALTDKQLEDELEARGLTKKDIIIIDDTSAVMNKKDLNEFLELFKDESKKDTITHLYSFNE